MVVVLFEDAASAHLRPLTYCNSVQELRCGIFTSLERVRRRLPTAVIVPVVRPELASVLSERTGLVANARFEEADLYVNASVLLDSQSLHALTGVAEDTVFMSGGEVCAVRAARPDTREWCVRALIAGELVHRPDSITVASLDAFCVRYPWDLIAHNETMLRNDAETFPLGTIEPSAAVSSKADVIEPARVSVCAGVEIGSGVVIDASAGPVVIDEGARIMHHAVVMGPAYVGRKSVVKAGAKVYGGTTIGPLCKAGGEIEGSIFQAYANKQHEGFLGHSYLSPWTNLGADTNTSDLKNNYSAIRITLEGAEHATGRMFLGLIMADHSKCGINTMFNTGTSAGVGCNIFGAGYPPKYIPSFAWGGSDGFEEYGFERFLATARVVMMRRNVVLSEAEEQLLRGAFVQTSYQRTSFTSLA